MSLWRRAGSLLVATLVAGLVTVAGPAATAAGTSTISGLVFQDQNRNGVQDPGEAPFANVFLYLFDASGHVVTTAYSDASGHFLFGGLADGSYRVAIAPGYWPALENGWVMTSHPSPGPGYLDPQVPVSLSGSASAVFALRPILRSTSPVTTVTTPGGTVINSFDDVVTAADVAGAMTAGSMFGAEQPLTTIDFDRGPSQTSTQVSGAPGSFFGYQATVDLRYTDWVDQFDWALFYEYGHAWSMYYMYIVQQDPSLASYLAARGLTGNPNLDTSQLWAPLELIADDYRQLFGSATARSYPQDNSQIPPAGQVPGLAAFLASTFTQPTFRQPSPSVTGIAPAMGPAGGGTPVTVDGTNFSGPGWAVTGVSFGGVPAASYSVASATSLVAVAPPGSGVVDVTVSTRAASDGYGETSATTPADRFTAVPAPAVTGISPARGSMKGGTPVTITGTGFSGSGFTATSVSFGGVPAVFSVTSPTTIVATSPPSRALQAVSVTVATPGAPGGVPAPGGFTYTRR